MATIERYGPVLRRLDVLETLPLPSVELLDGVWYELLLARRDAGAGLLGEAALLDQKKTQLGVAPGRGMTPDQARDLIAFMRSRLAA
jgi:hypothetical protein